MVFCPNSQIVTFSAAPPIEDEALAVATEELCVEVCVLVDDGVIGKHVRPKVPLPAGITFSKELQDW